MRRLERWSLRIGFFLGGLTGVVYGWLRYFGSVKGDFGPEPSPWQPFWQHAHVLAAPVLLFALGVAVRGHVQGMLGRGVRRGRRTGLVLLVVAATPQEAKILARAKVLDGKCWTAPVLANRFIYCRNSQGDLVCVDVH